MRDQQLSQAGVDFFRPFPLQFLRQSAKFADQWFGLGRPGSRESGKQLDLF
jgi:hypothetical protein